MNPIEFANSLLPFHQVIRQHSGINIPPNREAVLAEKIEGRMRLLNLGKKSDYLKLLQSGPGLQELGALVELLTIGESHFFRHENQWQALRTHILPELLKRKAKQGECKLKVWSAGCSTGEEPYSFLLLLAEYFPFLLLNPGSCEIFATDLNRQSLKKAQEALFSARSVQRIPPHSLKKFFREEKQGFRLSSELKNRIQWHYHNLIRDPWSYSEMQGLDLVICRNVLIYFDWDHWKPLAQKFAEVLNPGAYLLLGPTEQLRNGNPQLHPVEVENSFFYRKRSEHG